MVHCTKIKETSNPILGTNRYFGNGRYNNIIILLKVSTKPSKKLPIASNRSCNIPNDGLLYPAHTRFIKSIFKPSNFIKTNPKISSLAFRGSWESYTCFHCKCRPRVNATALCEMMKLQSIDITSYDNKCHLLVLLSKDD
ncbi:hypothetical protein QQP08_024336 [Theobroma cacao]|nr:hypothetical protein QQP08_024336 [Theobroma cacao]